MSNINKQIDLIVAARKIRTKADFKVRSKRHRDYILKFIKNNRLIFISVLMLLLIQGTIEALLIFFGKNKLSFDNNFSDAYFWRTILLLVSAFLVASFLAIKQEKTLVIKFINDLRRRIFNNYLSKNLEKMSHEGQADLIAKIAYHLPLVSSGVSNSIIGIFRWLIYFFSASLVVIFSGLNIWVIAPFFGVTSLLIAIISYFIVKQYISQEVTFYSQIIKHSNLSLSERQFVKNYNLEKDVLKKFDDLVKFDSLFRVRRDLWIKMVFRSIFVLLILVSILTNIFYSEVAAWVNLINPDKKFLYFFLLIYLSRLFTESARIGLYFFPAQLGISLTNIKTDKSQRRYNITRISNTISFKSKKTKIYQTGSYLKKMDYSFFKGGRYLFSGGSYLLKRFLALLFGGQLAYKNKTIHVRIDDKRLSFVEFQKNFSSTWFINPDFYSEKSILEIIIGQDRESTTFLEIEKALRLLEENGELTKLFSLDNNFSLSAKNVWLDYQKSFALQTVHCLLAKPDLIIIDSRWLNNNCQEIEKIIKILSEKLPEAIIVIFSDKENNYLNYDKKFTLI